VALNKKIDSFKDLSEKYKLLIRKLDPDETNRQIKIVAIRLLWTSALYALYLIIFNPDNPWLSGAFFFALSVIDRLKSIVSPLSNFFNGSFFIEFGDKLLTKCIIYLIVANAGLILGYNYFVNYKWQRK
jgi:hypothetical protein